MDIQQLKKLINEELAKIKTNEATVNIRPPGSKNPVAQNVQVQSNSVPVQPSTPKENISIFNLSELMKIAADHEDFKSLTPESKQAFQKIEQIFQSLSAEIEKPFFKELTRQDLPSGGIREVISEILKKLSLVNNFYGSEAKQTIPGTQNLPTRGKPPSPTAITQVSSTGPTRVTSKPVNPVSQTTKTV
jgi:hypothetical protein